MSEASLGLSAIGAIVIDNCFVMRVDTGLCRSRMIELQDNRTRGVVWDRYQACLLARLSPEVFSFIQPLILPKAALKQEIGYHSKRFSIQS